MSVPVKKTAVQCIGRMFAILDVLATKSDQQLGDIAKATGLHPSTCHRLLKDMAVGNFVQQTGAGRYSIGSRINAGGAQA